MRQQLPTSDPETGCSSRAVVTQPSSSQGEQRSVWALEEGHQGKPEEVNPSSARGGLCWSLQHIIQTLFSGTCVPLLGVPLAKRPPLMASAGITLAS